MYPLPNVQNVSDQATPSRSNCQFLHLNQATCSILCQQAQSLCWDWHWCTSPVIDTNRNVCHWRIAHMNISVWTGRCGSAILLTGKLPARGNLNQVPPLVPAGPINSDHSNDDNRFRDAHYTSLSLFVQQQPCKWPAWLGFPPGLFYRSSLPFESTFKTVSTHIGECTLASICKWVYLFRTWKSSCQKKKKKIQLQAIAHWECIIQQYVMAVSDSQDWMQACCKGETQHTSRSCEGTSVFIKTTYKHPHYFSVWLQVATCPNLKRYSLPIFLGKRKGGGERNLFFIHHWNLCKEKVCKTQFGYHLVVHKLKPLGGGCCRITPIWK